MDRPDPEFYAVMESKRLLRTLRTATLATLDPDGGPFASLTAIATVPDGSPILLLSRLAAHTGHIERDGRCSLLLAQPGKGDPLAHPRLTVVGHAAAVPPDDRDAVRRRFLARNPKAELYADFPDFGFWLLRPHRAHLNGGFGKAAALSGPELITNLDGCAALVEHEADALAHMNADHRDAIALYATRLLGLAAGDWRLSGLDPEGADLVSSQGTGRLPFPKRVEAASELRQVLVALAAEARAQKD